MENKFSKSDIQEIASKLVWKPNNMSYNIIYMLIALTIVNVLLLIYVITIDNYYSCELLKVNKKIKKIKSKNSDFANKTKENLENNSNEIRYLAKRSERNSDNLSLSEKNGHIMPLFSNEIENNSLFTALNGK
jgi:hypothetical protein